VAGSSWPAEAARLLGAAAALRDAIGAPLRPSEQMEYGQLAEATRLALREPSFATAWAEGRGMKSAATVALATTLLAALSHPADRDSITSHPLRTRTAASGRGSRTASVPPGSQDDLQIDFDLTRREREVLRLLCQRFTGPEIAAQLYISPSTASRHVANIYSKLGVSGRREAAAIATRHALV